MAALGAAVSAAGGLMRYDPVAMCILTIERWNESAAPPSGTARKRAAFTVPSSKIIATA